MAETGGGKKKGGRDLGLGYDDNIYKKRKLGSLWRNLVKDWMKVQWECAIPELELSGANSLKF